MSYHVYLITIFSFLKVHPSAPANASSTAQQRCIASAVAVHDLIQTHRSKWRRAADLYTPIEHMQLMIVCLYTLLEDLNCPRSRQAFIDIAVAARAMARRFQLARGMLRQVQLTARQQNIRLPEEVRPIFQEFEREWYRTGGVENFSSSYPNFALSLRSIAASSNCGDGNNNGGNDNNNDKHKELFAGSAELDLFLKKWDDELRIDDGDDNDEM